MASIKCGNCEGRHGSVEDVKSCYAGRKMTATAPATTRPTFRTNRYAGRCALCGTIVEAEAGRILPRDGGGNGYDVLHLAGECPKAEAPAPAPARREVKRDYSAVTGGYYATVSPRADQDYDFWYVKEGRKPGYRFVKRYLGGSGPIRISGAEALRALETILSEGVEKCGIRFADEHQRCWKCGLPLTDELSRERRQGPICFAK